MPRVDPVEPARPDGLGRSVPSADDLLEEESWIAEKTGADEPGARFSLDERRSA